MINLEPNKFYNNGELDLFYLGDIRVTDGKPAVDDTFSQFLCYSQGKYRDNIWFLDVKTNKISEKRNGKIEFPKEFPDCTHTEVWRNLEPNRFEQLRNIYNRNLEKALEITN